MKFDFSSLFEALTANAPLRWQSRLFARLLMGDIPAGCDLPTGLGKTSVIPIWLSALVSSIEAGDGRRLPRRLIYIVNRRTVVDQATAVTERLRTRILGQEVVAANARETLDFVVSTLNHTRAFDDGPCLAVSTLRGELADNEEWKADPTRAAIIIGTIDMIGSKLLFSGYGDGPYRRAHHAGLVGQDTLIVHDEAHLTPAFSELIRGVANVQRECREPRPVQVMELSATTRTTNDAASVLTLEAGDENDRLVRERLDAGKRVKIHAAPEGRLVETIIDLASGHENSRSKVLIYVRSPEDATKIVAALEKKLGREAGDRIALLTGTIRGFERDRLVESDPVYRSFLTSGSRPDATEYLVATSAGEVGIDLDADQMVCDSTTLDSMIQRFGRVNRRGGEERVAMIDVVESPPTKKKEPDPRVSATLSVLRQLPRIDDRHDGSPRALRRLLADLDEQMKDSAWSAPTEIVPLTDIVLDAWALTSVRGLLPGRPDVASYLHGITSDPPETWIAWRWEIDELDKADIAPDIVTEWFRNCRIESVERLRDRTDRIRKSLADLLDNHRKQSASSDFRLVLLDERGEAQWAWLSDVVQERSSIEYLTLVLPAKVGGLDSVHGALDPSCFHYSGSDVADKVHTRYRRLAMDGEDMSAEPGFVEKYCVELAAADEESEDDSKVLALFVSKETSALNHPETTAACQSLADHSQQIADCAARLVGAAQLEEETANALILAARHHDDGKSHPIWQRYASNRNAVVPLAKSTRYLHGRALGGYRHEFGSLLEFAKDPELLENRERDLVLHLIAAHHDWARPHFEPRAFDSRFTTDENEQQAHEVMRRFARLQQRFGRWGLAWLESLLRSSDIAASRAAAKGEARA